MLNSWLLFVRQGFCTSIFGEAMRSAEQLRIPLCRKLIREGKIRRTGPARMYRTLPTTDVQSSPEVKAVVWTGEGALSALAGCGNDLLAWRFAYVPQFRFDRVRLGLSSCVRSVVLGGTSLLDYYGSILLPYTTSSGYKSTIYRYSQQRWTHLRLAS